MSAPEGPFCSAFDHHRLIASGLLSEVVRAAKLALDAGAHEPLLIFDNASSRQIEIDFRGTLDAVLARLPPGQQPATVNRGPGRPKLGVVAREVTLLPRHWDWLGQQPGGASAILRRLVEQAARSDAPKQHARLAMEAVDRFMQTMTGDFSGHEEASRAFYRGEQERFASLIATWPVDVRTHLSRLVRTAWDANTG
ncbi:MAG: DUF2239 family protein [Rhodanobacter sp.]